MGVELRNSELEVVGKRPSSTLSFFSPTPPVGCFLTLSYFYTVSSVFESPACHKVALYLSVPLVLPEQPPVTRICQSSLIFPRLLTANQSSETIDTCQIFLLFLFNLCYLFRHSIIQFNAKLNLRSTLFH